MLLGPRFCSFCFRGSPEFLFQGSALVVRSWLEVVKPGEEEEEENEEKGEPDAC